MIEYTLANFTVAIHLLSLLDIFAHLSSAHFIDFIQKIFIFTLWDGINVFITKLTLGIRPNINLTLMLARWFMIIEPFICLIKTISLFQMFW